MLWLLAIPIVIISYYCYAFHCFQFCFALFFLKTIGHGCTMLPHSMACLTHSGPLMQLLVPPVLAALSTFFSVHFVFVIVNSKSSATKDCSLGPNSFIVNSHWCYYVQLAHCQLNGHYVTWHSMNPLVCSIPVSPTTV